MRLPCSHLSITPYFLYSTLVNMKQKKEAVKLLTTPFNLAIYRLLSNSCTYIPPHLLTPIKINDAIAYGFDVIAVN